MCRSTLTDACFYWADLEMVLCNTASLTEGQLEHWPVSNLPQRMQTVITEPLQRYISSKSTAVELRGTSLNFQAHPLLAVALGKIVQLPLILSQSSKTVDRMAYGIALRSMAYPLYQGRKPYFVRSWYLLARDRKLLWSH